MRHEAPVLAVAAIISWGTPMGQHDRIRGLHRPSRLAMGAAMSNFPDAFISLPAEDYDRRRAARLAEMGLTLEAADLLLDQACAEFDAFLAIWIGHFPAGNRAALFELLSDRAAQLAQEICE